MLSLEKVSQKGMNRLLRPLAVLLDVLAPQLPAVTTQKNDMYPDLQLLYDNGGCVGVGGRCGGG
jgi:hypothetical protein